MSAYLPGSFQTVPSSPRVSAAPSLVSVRSRSTAPISPRMSLTQAERPASPVRERLASRLSPRARQTLKSMEKIGEKLGDRMDKHVDKKKESNDINMVVDEIMKLIDKYGNNHKVHEVLKVHSWDKIKRVLSRAAYIYAIRWEIMSTMDVLEQFKHFEYMGDEVKEARRAIVEELMEQITKKHLLKIEHEGLESLLERFKEYAL
jgi:hypothetical protein